MKSFSSKMKASYRHKSKSSALVRLFVVLGITILVLFGVRHFFGTIVSTVTTPIYVVRNWVSESTAPLPSYVRSRNDLLLEIETLEEELALTTTAEERMKRLQAENEEFRSLYSISEPDRIVAGVIARPPHLPYDALLIDRGASDGVRVDSVVYYNGDHVLGFVSRVYRQSALVTLFSTPGVTAAGYIYGPEVYTTLHGEGAGVLRVSVPHGLTIETGDLVVLPSLAPGIVGEIDEVRSVPSEPEQHGYVVFDTPLQSLRLVSVSTVVPESLSFEEAQERISSYSPQQFAIPVPPAFRLQENKASTTASSSPQASTSVEFLDASRETTTQE